jgi:hypothetical protein
MFAPAKAAATAKSEVTVVLGNLPMGGASSSANDTGQHGSLVGSRGRGAFIRQAIETVKDTRRESHCSFRFSVRVN